MPRHSTYQLRWRSDLERYAIGASDTSTPLDVAPESDAWRRWLASVASFSFESRRGQSCTLRKEARQRGGDYWYAYRRTPRGVAKRYVGRSAEMTLARLEAIAAELDGTSSEASVQDVAENGGRKPKPRPTVPSARAQSTSTNAARVAGQPPASDGWAGPAAGGSAPPADTLRRVLLNTKLYVPSTTHAPARLVSRPAIDERLREGLRRPLTLLTAPAGFGKTTALRAWVRESGLPVAWVSLDAEDNDPVLFWSYVLTALNNVYLAIAGSALAMLADRQPAPLPAVLRTFANAVAALPPDQDVVLILDDYHLASSPAIDESASRLLEHPPAQLHLYLATRSEPVLPSLARLRAYDQVNELRADDLRFSLDEANTFLGEVMGVRLAPADVAQLTVRTDGWAAGLQIAALSLRGHPDPARFVASFGGSHRRVLTYVGEEVLAAQPQEIQSFLLETSILERMCGPLCDAVTGRTDGQALLERLEQANLFLMPLDDEGRWYRYFHLFADLLRHRLRETSPAQLAELHRRAARWLEDEGWIVEAAQHLFAVPDFAEAARVIETAAERLGKLGEVATLLHLLERLPDDVVAARPALALTHAELFLGVGRLEDADRRLAQAEQRLLLATPVGDGRSDDIAGDSSQRRVLAGQIAGDRAVIASMRGDADATVAYANIALDALPHDLVIARAGVMIALGNAHMLNGDVAAAEADVVAGVQLSFAGGHIYLATIALGQQASALVPQGRLREAVELYRQVIHISETERGASRAMAGDAFAELGARLYQWNDLAGAAHAFEQAIAIGRQWVRGYNEVMGQVGLAGVYQAQGRPADAAAAFAEAERVVSELVQAHSAFPWVLPSIAALGARLALRQGRLEAAERWLRGRGLEGLPYPLRGAQLEEVEYLTFARVLIARGALENASRLLEGMAPAAEVEGRTGSVIEISALRALVAQARGASTHALALLRHAVTLAAPEGYMRVFVDEGMPMRALLARLRETTPRGSTLRRTLDALLAAFDSQAGAAPRQPESDALIEPLSEREREVLQLLAQGRSNAEIARALVVALSTVKTHVHHLYAKLGATDRLQAVMRARELGLLER